MSDFSDRPLVAGSLTGIRSFKVDEYGRLRGVTVPAVFRPGENVATCPRDKTTVTGSPSVTTRLAVSGEVPAEQPKATEHRVGELGCGCGFYAYFDEDTNPHHHDGNVLALVEGYGVCAVGTRGFRAEKARLLAFIEGADARGSRLDRMAAPLYDWGAWIAGSSAALAIASGAATVPLSTTVSPWFAFLSAVPLVMIFLFYLSFRSMEVHYDRRTGDARVPATVRRNYPDVPVLSYEAALRRFPLTPPAPPSPDDPDFWMRGDLT